MELLAGIGRVWELISTLGGLGKVGGGTLGGGDGDSISIRDSISIGGGGSESSGPTVVTTVVLLVSLSSVIQSISLCSCSSICLSIFAGVIPSGSFLGEMY